MLIMMMIIVIRMIRMMMTNINEASVKCFLFKKKLQGCSDHHYLYRIKLKFGKLFTIITEEK